MKQSRFWKISISVKTWLSVVGFVCLNILIDVIGNLLDGRQVFDLNYQDLFFVTFAMIVAVPFSIHFQLYIYPVIKKKLQ